MASIKKMFGGGKKKSPTELVRSTENHLQVLLESNDPKLQKKSKEKLSSNLSQMKLMLYGDGETDAKVENIKKLCEELFKNNLIFSLLKHISSFEFEAKKGVAHVFAFVLRQRPESVEYVKKQKEILNILVEGYKDPKVALHCGSILREVIRHEDLNNMLLNDPALLYPFFEYVQLPSFDVASDAFYSFKQMLTKHGVSCSKFLESNFEPVFKEYNVLLQSDNYVTKRQSLKLLGELLLNRQNFSVMMQYINSPVNLKIMMNLLRGNTKAIQFEAFHVFKIFVANPKKSKPVLEILVRNKDKLIEFLHKFQKDKDEDQFNDEKKILLETLEKLDASMLEEKKCS